MSEIGKIRGVFRKKRGRCRNARDRKKDEGKDGEGGGVVGRKENKWCI